MGATISETESSQLLLMKKQKLTEQELHILIRDQSRNGNEHTQIKIIDKIITESFNLIGGGFTATVYFEECIFLDKFDFGIGSTEFPLYFSHCYFYNSIGFLGVTFSKTLAFVNCKLNGDLMIIESTINELMLDFTACKKIFFTYNSKFKKVSLSGRDSAIFEEIGLNLNSIEGVFYIRNCNFRKIFINSDLTGLQKDTQLEISKCKINSIFIDDVTNNGILKLNYIEALNNPNNDSFFTINKSNLGKAEFIQCDFSSFSEMNVLNSFLGDCIFVNTSWGMTNINVFEGKEMDGYLKDREVRKSNKILSKLHIRSNFKETKSQLTHKKDIFKQIKYALSKQGDFINEKKFYALEMTTYNKSLPFNIKTCSTKIILCLSKLTSNYGLSLSRPIVLIVSNLIPFYFLVLNGKIPNVYSVPLSESNWYGIYNAIAQFLYILNPIRNFETNLNGLDLIFDIWIRIVSSYALYNIIRATRRFIN